MPRAAKRTTAGKATGGAKKAAKKAAAKKSAARRTPAKKTAAGKKAATARKAPARKAATAGKAPARKAPAGKAPARKAPAKKAATARKAPAKKAATARKAPAKKARSAALDKFLEAQRQALIEERSVYTRQAQSLRAEAEKLAEDWEPGDATFDEEGGEGDSLNVERERDLALSAAALAAIEEIDKALGKIDLGTYGICERCEESIPRERLKAVPQAALCVRCKTGGLGRR